MKKYYGFFIYGDKEYVVRFKIDGSLKWDTKFGCFEDKDFYVRSFEDMVAYVLFNTSPVNIKIHFWALKITHQEFIKQRAHGVKRWVPENEIIKWD